MLGRPTTARSASGWATCSGSAATTWRRSWPRGRPRPAGASATWATWPRGPARGRRRSRASPGRAPATPWPAGTAAIAPVAARDHRARAQGARGGRSSPCPSTPPRRRRSPVGRLGGGHRRLRHHRRLGPAPTRWRCCAPSCPRTPSRRRPARAAPRPAGAHRRPGRGPPAPGHGQGRGLPAHRGRDGDGQHRRPAEALRAPPSHGAHRAAHRSSRAGWRSCRRPAGRSTCS